MAVQTGADRARLRLAEKLREDAHRLRNAPPARDSRQVVRRRALKAAKAEARFARQQAIRNRRTRKGR